MCLFLRVYNTNLRILHPTVNLATYHAATQPEAPRKLYPKIKNQAQITFYGIKIIKCDWYENYSDTLCDHGFLVSLMNWPLCRAMEMSWLEISPKLRELVSNLYLTHYKNFAYSITIVRLLNLQTSLHILYINRSLQLFISQIHHSFLTSYLTMHVLILRVGFYRISYSFDNKKWYSRGDSLAVCFVGFCPTSLLSLLPWWLIRRFCQAAMHSPR